MSHDGGEVHSKDPEQYPEPSSQDAKYQDSESDELAKDSSTSSPRVNPFSRFAYVASQSSQSRLVRSPDPSRSLLGKRKATIDTLDKEEEHSSKARRTASRVQSKSSPRPAGSNKVKIYEHLREIDDNLDAGLDIVFCGINPSKQSAEIGHHYGNPNNHFWSCLHESGLTSRRLDPREDASLPRDFSIGLMNLTDRPTAEQSELSKAEQVAGVPKVLDKVAQYQPRVLCFVGLGIADIVKSEATLVGPSGTARPSKTTGKAAVGLQPYKMVHSNSTGTPETLFFAVSSTSGRVVRYQKSDKVRQFQDLRDLLARLKNGNIDTTDMLSVRHLTG